MLHAQDASHPIVPGQRVGPVSLGMSVRQALALADSLDAAYAIYSSRLEFGRSEPKVIGRVEAVSSPPAAGPVADFPSPVLGPTRARHMRRPCAAGKEKSAPPAFEVM